MIRVCKDEELSIWLIDKPETVTCARKCLAGVRPRRLKECCWGDRWGALVNYKLFGVLRVYRFVDCDLLVFWKILQGCIYELNINTREELQD